MVGKRGPRVRSRGGCLATAQFPQPSFAWPPDVDIGGIGGVFRLGWQNGGFGQQHEDVFASAWQHRLGVETRVGEVSCAVM